MKLSNIYQTLSQIRKEQNLPQQEIAEFLNVEQATISMYETGKRGIPLDVLDRWLDLLEIEVKFTPRGYEPAKPSEDMESALKEFTQLKKRRNYLIAELRAMAAEKIAREPKLQKKQEETGENVFWPYSFGGDPSVGLVETRYDHPQQKYLAVEYTKNEVNVYKFLAAQETTDGQSDQEWLGINRIYFSEDDFLTLGGKWDIESMEDRKVTILRRNKKLPDGAEIVNAEEFSIRTLMEIQDNFVCLAAALAEAESLTNYAEMETELDIIDNQLLDISLNNRLKNGAMAPEFIFWTENDITAVDVPLWAETRNWHWIEEGVEWIDEEEKNNG